MKSEEFERIKRWFNDYLEQYLQKARDEDVRENFKLKAEHTFKVEENIVRLADSLGLNDSQKNIARAIAFLHDVGRFPQYLQYRTFRDAESVNHGVLSSEIVEKSGILEGLSDGDRDIIIEAVKFHNSLSLPDKALQSPALGLFLKLIRDADKLDIWRVFREYFSLPAEQRNKGTVLGLPDTEGVSEEILTAIREKRIAFLKDVKNQNDFRMLQLSWVFDLNFKESFRIVKEVGHLSLIGDISKPSESVINAIREVEDYIERKLKSKVYFIGAGPGDPELLTVKGRRILNSAEVVIYAGSLINPALLEGLRADLYDSSGMTLDEIIERIKLAYQEAKTVVRLHSGDLSIYSAINEQIERLRRLNIDFELIPGVSSFQAGAAILAQELTIPEASQTIILTRLEGRTPVPEKERLRDLAVHNATMIIFLSAGMADKVQEELLQAYPEDTPFVVIEKATWPEQSILRGRLKELAETVRKAGIKKTALIYVGKVFRELGDLGRESRLYDSKFRHSYRN
ncbi:MAG: precorrin-4 C(11)-methyltransferase [Thermodesulfovibrionales bacterium]|nr:precorrin-4 C(11)-methyltransferase [Thermodesulfovibrionales bacterium]